MAILQEQLRSDASPTQLQEMMENFRCQSLPLKACLWYNPAAHGLETTPRQKMVARSQAAEPKWKSEFDGASKKLGKAEMSWVVLTTY